MSILCIWIEDQHSTVFMKIPEQNSAVRQEIFEYGLSDTSQIAGDDPVIVRDISAGVDEVLTDGISCGRSHGCTHVHGIFDTIIHYFSGGNTADTAVSLSGTGVFLGGNDKGTGTGDRPGS